MATSTFIKKWNGKHLQDDGICVSKEYNTFQNAFKREMTQIAQNIGATLVKFSKGHYDVWGFIERNGKYVYFNYDTSLCGGRATPKLKDGMAMLCRTAENVKDYRGGDNNFTSFEDCESVIDRLLNTEHKRAF